MRARDAEASAAATAIASGRAIRAVRPVAIAVRRLRRLEGPRVAERVLSGLDVGQRVPVIGPPGGRDRRVRGSRGNLRGSKEGKFLGMRNTRQQLEESEVRYPFTALLTELSNLARLRRPPSTMFSTLISVTPSCSLALPEEEPGAPSPLLSPLKLSPWLSPFSWARFLDDRDRPFFPVAECVLADALRRPRPPLGEGLRKRDVRDAGRGAWLSGW